ncbi:hypothetical protein SPRG_11734 [Saprolegnia parasitica CBS 223.65]|uniref:Ig-like domain-containing protein n=1 Tax=Saprolegnia parasitica (strain CBS 223.65) TaxID=695850 RepID=A0A067C6W6_SAPPC|nr:hypothetical protein SPRG_11734 [Saprolegnia parasitica CBS 223.65]KDO22552.1 hypothetical protein SPRG_11734 [Saprolegnia parasitica CBS 223.65]|eukprot:XP_012206798.1 hypothetical protein SPRG_11734 [Saprolegnia parasitica CBS 223.65]
MQSWRGLVAWRHRVLQKRLKRDPLRATENEEDWLFLLEHRLLLHALVLSTDTNACSDRRRRWMQELLDAGDANAQGLDRQERTLLHHAVLQNWGIDDIAWVVKLFPGAAEDCDGFAPITYATLRGCCDEVILQMAIAVAKAVYADASQSFDDGNYEGCKRLLATATKETLSAVPHFDYAHVQAALALDAKAASTELLEYWAAFIALWGYFDPPEIIEDLTPKRRVALGSHVALTVAAKGEPLSYQWYCGDDVLSGCTSATLDVTDSAAPEDEGQYWCRITNWRGGVCSAMLTLLVHDDTVVVDPSTRYYIPKDQRRGACFNVLGNTGAVLEHGGVQLLVPPGSFRVVDMYDTDLASTRGMDVCMHVTTTAPDVVQPSPDEDFGHCVRPSSTRS